MGKPAWGGCFGGCTPSPGEGAPLIPSVTSKAMGGGITREGCVPGPQYHNPDLLVRLIGTPNDTQCRLKLPDIAKFDLDVLMLVVDDSPYGMRVPIQIGTLHIDMALDLASEEEKRKLNHQWKRAELAASPRMKNANAKADDSDESQPTFNLAQVNDSVHLTQNLSLLPFEDVTLKGLLKSHVKRSGYFKTVNVALELLKQHKKGKGTFCAVLPILSLNPVQIILK